MTHYLSPALVQLRHEINAVWPGRDKRSDGTIGDAAHAARSSDHNPDKYSKPPGIIRAMDIDIDGIDVPWLLSVLTDDPRVRYVIHNRKIWQVTEQRWSPYAGASPHTGHIHVSIRKVDGYDQDASAWGLMRATPVVNPVPAPAPAPAVDPRAGWSAEGRQTNLVPAQVVAMQRGLNKQFPAYSKLALDGVYGPRTTAVVAEFQRRSRLVPDGIVGPITKSKLRQNGITF